MNVLTEILKPVGENFIDNKFGTNIRKKWF